MRACMYLRKSRADLEAETNSNIDTLARHREQLNALSLKMGIPVLKEYKEIVSGDSIAARPVMQELLNDIEKGLWDAVFVVEIERLARGATIDQGIIAQTFKYTGTKIITPLKTYDPNNEFDEEYFEFGLFMSRREYKTINRRLQAGRLASVKEGKYVGSIPPYGYERVKLKNEKGYTLAPVPEQAEVVKMIFNLYVNGLNSEHMGTAKIARYLNSLGIKSAKSDTWVPVTVRDMLRNPVYNGKIKWNSRPANKKMQNGVVVRSRPRNEESNVVICNGLHPAIIDDITFARAQQIINSNERRPAPYGRALSNPLAGLIVCSKCGKKMVRRPYSSGQTPTLMCANINCDNISAPFPAVEEHLLKAIREWVGRTELKLKAEPPKTNAETKHYLTVIKNSTSELNKLIAQRDNIYTLLEKGVYNIDTFNERLLSVDRKIETLKSSKDELEELLRKAQGADKAIKLLIPKAKHLLEVYGTLNSAKDKNKLLSEVVEYATYLKTSNGRWHNSPDDFTLTLYPKIQNP